ncbi:hypothetical protein U0021_07900 [Moraxella canis]|uniref:Uncharacterized protein n=1 Tax=Moraxella canis TaxID=90239 RepID=A0ABZ0WWX2_9GAMM|nr:hypothetical protein [Moraxella canis]WQE03660.1 hypothetical protein U0021_07900 [Moraxella canis]
MSECVLKYRLYTAFSITLTKNRQNNFVLTLFIKTLKNNLGFGYWLDSSVDEINIKTFINSLLGKLLLISVVIVSTNQYGLSLKSIKIANWLMHLSLIGLNLPKIHNFLRKISIFTSFYRHFMANCNNLRQNVACFR